MRKLPVGKPIASTLAMPSVIRSLEEFFISLARPGSERPLMPSVVIERDITGSLADHFAAELSLLYDCEQQSEEVYPRLADLSCTRQVCEEIVRRGCRVPNQLWRLEQVAGSLGIALGRARCKSFAALLREGFRSIRSRHAWPAIFNGSLGDWFRTKPRVLTVDRANEAAILTCAEKIEQHKIACYRAVCVWASILGYEQEAILLERTLTDDIETQQTLACLAIAVMEPAQLGH